MFNCFEDIIIVDTHLECKVGIENGERFTASRTSASVRLILFGQSKIKTDHRFWNRCHLVTTVTLKIYTMVHPKEDVLIDLKVRCPPILSYASKIYIFFALDVGRKLKKSIMWFRRK